MIVFTTENNSSHNTYFKAFYNIEQCSCENFKREPLLAPFNIAAYIE